MDDLVIRNATVVDGTGAAGFAADVAVSAGRIRAVGRIDGEATREIDADGRVLAPGFIDIHTHYDPQICWDRLATPSLEHGVTTVVMGNCSLSLAPVRPDGRRKLIRMFEKIEDIKEATFDAAVPFTWESFGDYLDYVRPGLGLNVGALVGHSALRYFVMGAASQERAATDAEIDVMCGLLEEAMAAGALGLSISYVDIDEDNRPVPSRLADMREKIALCRAMVKSGRGVLQTVPYFIDLEQQLANIAELGEISLASGVTCSIAPIIYSPINPQAWRRSVEALEAQRTRGAKVFGQSMPRSFDLNIRLSETSFLLYGTPGWNEIMKKPLAERIAAFADPSGRPALIDSASRTILPLMMGLRIGETYGDANRPLQGKMLVEAAAEMGRPLPDAMLEIALRDGLRTEFQLKGAIHADRDEVVKLLDHPLIHVGASDAGAHVSQFCGAGDTSELLSLYVRQRGDMSLERAVHRITGELAQAWGIPDRGFVRDGLAADLVLFDPARIGRGEETFVADFPGEARRYVYHAEGVDVVIVNGQIAREGGRYTEARAGVVV